MPEQSTPGERSLTVAVTQWGATRDLTSNLDIAMDMIGDAGGQHADLIVLPENCLCVGTNDEMRAAALNLESSAITSLRSAAAAAGVTVILGGFKRKDGSGSVRNTALVIGDDGEIIGGYDKIHLFDAKVGGMSFEASKVESRGDTPVMLSVKGIQVGLSVCYDVRFPELYRRLALAGAEVMLIPAAFAYLTGLDHWEVLLRARAIENGVFVVAPATIRPENHDCGFQTYGHALVVDPWGRVLLDLGDTQKECRVMTLDMNLVSQVRASLPVLRGVQPAAYVKAPRMISSAQPAVVE